MKLFYRICAAVLVCTAAISILAGCKESGEAETEQMTYSGMPEYDVANIEKYIKPFVYTGLTVYRENSETAAEALWAEVVASAEVISYPAEQLEYYVEQERAKYRYYASREDIAYDELLESLGVTEESILDTARGFVKDDLVLAYIVYKADISLTDAEKEAHTDKYAEKLSEVYGVDSAYIKNNMSEQVYDAMLYDKAMEYLLLNNTVYSKQSK